LTEIAEGSQPGGPPRPLGWWNQNSEREGKLMEPTAAPAAKGVFSNMMNWDPVAWMSVLMIIVSIVIVIFLYFKVSALIKQDADAHKNQPH
jgi:hypothetical protein